MSVGSYSEATGPEKDRPEVIIESEELMGEILRMWDFRFLAHLDEHPQVAGVIGACHVLSQFEKSSVLCQWNIYFILSGTKNFEGAK